MGVLHRLKLSQRFAVLTAIFALGFVVYGAWSLKTLDELKVNGPLYQRIVQGKDLVADILPPPEYIIESYLLCLQLSASTDKGEQDGLAERLKTLKGEYDARHEFWLKETLESELADIFLRQAHDPAATFFQTAFTELVPAVQQGDKDQAGAVMSRLKQLYETHRKAIDRVVQITNQRNATDEALAKERIHSATVLLLVIFAASLGAAVVVAVAITRGLLTSLGGEPEYAVEIAHSIANCNLAVKVETRAGDGSSLLAAMKTMQTCLSQIIGSINGSVAQLAQASARLSASAGRVSASSNQQHDATQSMAAAIEEISVSIEQITENANEAKQATLKSGELSAQGAQVAGEASMEMGKIAESVTHSSQHIKSLGEQSGKISAIVGVIKEIADQTNLLALNAAIEAARAGEQGRGFAVVADEVRQLAERTSQSTREIGEMIGTIQHGTENAVTSMVDGNTRAEEGVRMAGRARDSIEQIRENATRVIAEVSGISDSLSEQSAAHSQVAESVAKIAQKTEENSLEVQAIADAAAELEKLSSALQTLVSQFKVAG